VFETLLWYHAGQCGVSESSRDAENKQVFKVDSRRRQQKCAIDALAIVNDEVTAGARALSHHFGSGTQRSGPSA